MKQLLTKTFLVAAVLTGFVAQANANVCFDRAVSDAEMYADFNDAQRAVKDVVIAIKYTRCMSTALDGAYIMGEAEEAAVDAYFAVSNYHSYSRPVRDAMERLDATTGRVFAYLKKEMNRGEPSLQRAGAYLANKVYVLHNTL